MSIAGVRENFVEVGPGKGFSRDQGVVDCFVAAVAERAKRATSAPCTIDRERAMLRAFGRHVLGFLHRRATDVRSRHGLVLAAGAVG